MDELTAELAAAAWFESVRTRVMSASEMTEERQFGAGSVILTTVLSGIVRRLNPDLPHDTIGEVVAYLVAPATPDADPEQPLVPRVGHRRRRDRVPRIEQRRDARRPRAAGRFRQPGRERSTGTAPAQRRRSVGQDHPPGPDSVPERAAGRVDRAEGPDRHPGKSGRGHRPTRPLHADRPRPVRVEPGAGRLGRHADPRRLDHQWPQPLHALASD